MRYENDRRGLISHLAEMYASACQQIQQAYVYMFDFENTKHVIPHSIAAVKIVSTLLSD